MILLSCFFFCMRKYFIFCLFLLLGVMNYGNIAAEEMVVIRGQVFPPGDEKIPKDGLPVVLLKFILNDQGELSTDGPVARIQTTDSGKFEFEPILLSLEAAYRIGSRFTGNLVSSEFFFLTPGQTEANIHLVIPRVSETTEKLEVTNAALFIDAGLGHLQVTEVLTVTNPTKDNIDTSKHPLIFNLPESFTQFELLHHASESERVHEITGTQLQFHRLFARGETTLIFRYTLPVLLGSYKLQRQYRHLLKSGRVLTPVRQLQLESPQLSYLQEESLGELQMDSWKMNTLNEPLLVIHINAVPVNQMVYGVVGVGLFLVLMILALAFVRFRLKPEHRSNAG